MMKMDRFICIYFRFICIYCERVCFCILRILRCDHCRAHTAWMAFDSNECERHTDVSSPRWKKEFSIYLFRFFPGMRKTFVTFKSLLLTVSWTLPPTVFHSSSKSLSRNLIHLLKGGCYVC